MADLRDRFLALVGEAVETNSAQVRVMSCVRMRDGGLFYQIKVAPDPASTAFDAHLREAGGLARTEVGEGA